MDLDNITDKEEDINMLDNIILDKSPTFIEIDDKTLYYNNNYYIKMVFCIYQYNNFYIEKINNKEYLYFNHYLYEKYNNFV